MEMELFRKELDAITSFSDDFRWLSNFYLAPVVLDDVEYQSVEHAYQASKSYGDRIAFLDCTSGKAKRLGSVIELTEDWPARKLVVMKDLSVQKYKLGSVLAKRLSDTGDREIIEGNTWGDSFWGVCSGKGENHLGRILMDIRKSLSAKP
jgi:ribA/ribD-fused uncharacterized protein